MKWQNVKLIFRRELRDQLRDRRTLFTIAVLPLMLYPLLGMVGLQISQFMKQHPTKIWVIGAENLPESPALIAEEQITERFMPANLAPSLLELDFAEPPEDLSSENLERVAEEAIAKGTYGAGRLLSTRLQCPDR